MNRTNYFKTRELNPDFYKDLKVPRYILPYSPENESAKILNVDLNR